MWEASPAEAGVRLSFGEPGERSVIVDILQHLEKDMAQTAAVRGQFRLLKNPGRAPVDVGKQGGVQILEEEEDIAAVGCGADHDVRSFQKVGGCGQIFPREIRAIAADESDSLCSALELVRGGRLHAGAKIAGGLGSKPSLGCERGKPFAHLPFGIVRGEVNGDGPAVRDLAELVLNQGPVDVRGALAADFGGEARLDGSRPRCFEHEDGGCFHVAGSTLLRHSDQRNPDAKGSQRSAVSSGDNRHMPPGDST